jgi:hypothetical protein
MKKKYIFTALLSVLTYVGFAQIINDDFESYNTGPMLPTAHWTNWSQNASPSGIAENIVVTTAQAASGTKSGTIGNGGIQDALLLLGNLSSGQYTLEFNMYIPTGNSGYFNIQGTIPGGALTGVFNSGNITFDTSGAGLDDASGVTWSFPHDTWFPVSIAFDLDAAAPNYRMTINGVLTGTAPSQFQADPVLGGIDFFSDSSTHTAFYDDILFDVTSLSVDEFSKNEISVYPNPVIDKLKIKSITPVTSIAIYNILGKKVKDIQSDNPIKEIDMSSLSKGVYLVKINSTDRTQTIKVMK